MISGLIEFSIRYRTVVVLTAIVCAFAGICAAVHSPMDAVPDLSENQVIVFTNWPGHGPQDIEDHVTYPLSLQLQGLDGVRVVRGSSDMGYSMLYVIFEDRVSFGVARQRVQERLTSTEVRLPEGVVPRLAADGIPTGQIYWYTVEGVGHDLTELRRLQDWTIAPQLRSVAGVAEVASVGGFVAELKIQVDPGLFSAYGLTVQNLYEELSRPASNVGGHVIHKGNAEFVVQFHSAQESSNPVTEWEQRLIPLPTGGSLTLGDVAKVAWGPAIRRGMFEKDGNEVVAGIVHLRYGHNPLEVTRQVRARLKAVAACLPKGVRIVPCYDRTPLILGAVRTVTRALIEAILVAGICVLVVLRHFRAWIVIALTLPLSVLGTFLLMWLLRTAGVIDVQTNIMSLAGIVISIGVLVDSSIVMTENVMHRLRLRFGDEPVQGDVTDTIAAACQTVGWPVFCSVFVMLISFIPVFALGGIDGRMYRPLALTKSLALVSVAILAITLVPALCTFLVKGRIRDESDSAIVRSVVGVYRPMLSWLLDRPGPLVFFMCMTLVLAAIPLGNELIIQFVLFGSLSVILWEGTSSGATWRAIRNGLGLIVIALVGQNMMKPLGIEMRIPLDEGMVMDMPITIPRASIAQSSDDLKARNMVLCRFPEVAMVTGKAGRAETPFDPAPLDMIETMVELRPREMWPRRRLKPADALRITERMIQELTDARLIKAVSLTELETINDAVQFRFDAIQREAAYQLTNVFAHQLQQDLCRFLIEQIGRQLQASRRMTLPQMSRSFLRKSRLRRCVN
jgi:copper/silver efflux system protein